MYQWNVIIIDVFSSAFCGYNIYIYTPKLHIPSSSIGDRPIDLTLQYGLIVFILTAIFPDDYNLFSYFLQEDF